MGRRFLILRNILKAWTCLVVFALLLGALGWELGGYRLGILFIASAVLLATAVYWYADRIIMGMLGARELLEGESPILHSTVERLASRGPTYQELEAARRQLHGSLARAYEAAAMA